MVQVLACPVCACNTTVAVLSAVFQVLVEQLLMARRAEYASLAGWLGPRKFAGGGHATSGQQ